MPILCHAVQEAIAWGRALGPRDQDHILTCQACGPFLEQVTTLDTLVLAETDVEVPADFADRVMARASAMTPDGSRTTLSPGHHALPAPGDLWSRLWERPAVRWAFVQAAFVLGATNLRFVFSLLIADTTWGGTP